MAGSTLPPAPGDVRGRQMGNYEVICRLSAGGMAEIFLASRKGLAGFHKPVVLKKILPDIQGQEEFVQMFLDEARVTAAFNHPNIAQVFDLDVDHDELFLAMEFVPGATLLEIARVCAAAKEPIPMGLSLATVRDTALALHYAHTFTDALGEPAPVIHRDVAEKNIMVTYEGVTKLLDFGIAKSMAAVSRTQVGMVKGTSGYMSPEQILGEPLDARSDLFSLGVVLHECLTGMRLFPGKQPTAVVNAVLRAPIPEPSRINKNVPPELDAIVLKVLSRKRGDRYATALEFARELERAVGPLIWLPEQSGELLRRLFAERREQTRQMLASGRSATGELKLTSPAVEREAAAPAHQPFLPPPPAPPAPAPTRLPSIAPPQFNNTRQDHNETTDINLSTLKSPATATGAAETRIGAAPPPPPTEPTIPVRTRTGAELPRTPRAPTPSESARSAPEPAPARARSMSRAELPVSPPKPQEEEELEERDIKTAIIRAPRTPAPESAPPPRPAPTRPARRLTGSVLDAVTQPAGTPALLPRSPGAPPRTPDEDDEGPEYVTVPLMRPPPAVSLKDEPDPHTDQVRIPEGQHEEITASNSVLRSPAPPPASRAKGWVLGGLAVLGLGLAAGAWLVLHPRPTPSPPPSPLAQPAQKPPATPPSGSSTPSQAPSGTGAASQTATPPAEPTQRPTPAPEATTPPPAEEPAPEAPAVEAASPASPKRPKSTPGRTRHEPAPSAPASATPSAAPSPPPSPPPSPEAAADPGAAAADPEQLWHVLERVRAGAPEPTDATGLLTLTTDQYAQVYLGSHSVGETPLFNVTMPAGRYTLRVVGPDNQPMKLPVEIKAGEVTKRRISFDNPTP